tara:strand:- start:9401 stop:10051 length:651 start_codon:yes stop_codon:yes gene_type:complete
MYSIKEAFYSLQGEGAHAGRPALFCRFTGCNLWSGSEKTRTTSECQFCDTDFIGTNGQHGGKFKTAEQLRTHIDVLWPGGQGHKYVVFTGGEPALQLDDELIVEMKQHGYTIAIETNGTMALPDGIDWICVSPKTAKPLVVTKGDELKLVYPQSHISPDYFETLDFSHFYLQPMDQSHLTTDQIPLIDTQQATLHYCLSHPRWRLSLQTHKMLNID